MVSNTKNELIIDAGFQDTSRPKERLSKTNWKTELVKKSLGMLQYISPRKASTIVWHHFTKPGRSRFTENQKAVLDKAEVGKISYLGYEIFTYKWGTTGPKVLLSHGWNSKIADFRKMIEAFVEAGYVVEGVDMKAHGNSEGRHTAMPEMRDILKDYYIRNAPFHAVIGYSIGGAAAGIMLSELSREFQPAKLFLIASPSYIKYFFHDVIVKDLGFRDSVYEEMCTMVYEHYHQSIDYFDLRIKQDQLSKMDMHLIYDEDDATVGFERGEELRRAFPEASFVRTRGLGHYRIISYDKVISYVVDRLKIEVVTSV
jgi:pimeloyl-ACP methyl ester carboxylesterase